jgi:hypothetical protein
MRSYVRTRAWSDSELDDAEGRLVTRGLVADGAFTDLGRDARESVEVATDDHCRPFVDALGAEADELVAILGAWSTAIMAAGGYPSSGPHDLAAMSAR